MRSFAIILAAAATVVSAETFKVVVGRDANNEVASVFTPNQVAAKAGDRIQFEFRAKNHTITQSSFAEPCTRQFNTATQLPGIDSGFLPAPEGATEISMFEVELLQDQAPLWFFCNRQPHCNGGMVFAINAPAEGERTFDKFVEKAKTANHPDPELGQTADFTPPNAGGGAPAGDAPASGAPSDSAPPSGPDAPASTTASTSANSAPTEAAANAAPAPASGTSGALKLSSGRGAVLASLLAIAAGIAL